MMRSIVATSLRLRFLVMAAALGLMVSGAVSLRDTSVDVFPEFAPPRVEVQTSALGLTAVEVENLITVPLEQVLNGVAGLDEMRSKSVPQLSSIELIFTPGTDLLTARQQVQERLTTITPTLPSWATPPFVMQPLSATSRALKIGLSSDTMTLTELSTVTRFKIRPRLMRVEGVANVAVWGQRKEQVQVMVEPERMAARGVTLDDVLTSTSGAMDAGLLRYAEGSVVGTGGSIDTPNQRVNISHVLPVVTPQDLAEVIIRPGSGLLAAGGTGTSGGTTDVGTTVATNAASGVDDPNGTVGGTGSTNGTVDGTAPPAPPVRLADVAQLTVGHQPLIGDAVINDGPGLMLIVEKLPWGNTLEVTRGVEEALRALEPGLAGIDVDSTIFRPATFIEMSIDNLSTALLLGCLMVILVLVSFLFQWRTAVISLIAIPLSLMAAAVVLDMRGATVNTMVLAGLVIAVGVVVDDAIIDIENIVRRLRQHRRENSTRSTARIVLDASLEVRGPIVYATLIIVVAAAPVFFLEGLTGAFFRPLALSYTLAVFASMLVALTVTPALALLLLGRAPLTAEEPPLVRVLQRWYLAVLRRIIRRPRGGYAAAASLVVAGVAVVPLLGQSMLPSFKEQDFLMHWLAQPGTSHPEMVRITTQGSKELRQIPGVRNFGAHIGQAENADEVVGMYFGENWVSVDPKESDDYDATVASIQHVVDGYPGLFRDVQTYLKERIREVLTGSGDAIVVRIYGDDLETLRDKALEVQDVLAGVDGVVEEHTDLQVDIPQIEVEVDLAAAQQYGLKPGDVRRAAATMVASTEVNDLWRGGKVFDVNIWSLPEDRDSVDSIAAMPLDTPDGRRVRLDQVADVRVAPTPNLVERDGGSRRIDVGANVRDRDLGSVIEDIEAGLADVDYPVGYHAELLGEHAERQAAEQRLLAFAGVAVLAVYLLLQASYGSWRLATLSLFTLPVALVGGVLAAAATSGVLSLGSLVGFFAVLGIAARNGILLISHCQHLEREEGMTFGPELVLRGARERLAPILMTTLATGLALVPLVVLGEIPGHEIEHPMAVVILGGLVTSTLLNLLVLPSLLLAVGRRRGSGTPTEREVAVPVGA